MSQIVHLSCDTFPRFTQTRVGPSAARTCSNSTSLAGPPYRGMRKQRVYDRSNHQSRPISRLRVPCHRVPPVAFCRNSRNPLLICHDLASGCTDPLAICLGHQGLADKRPRLRLGYPQRTFLACTLRARHLLVTQALGLNFRKSEVGAFFLPQSFQLTLGCGPKKRYQNGPW